MNDAYGCLMTIKERRIIWEQRGSWEPRQATCYFGHVLNTVLNTLRVLIPLCCEKGKQFVFVSHWIPGLNRRWGYAMFYSWMASFYHITSPSNGFNVMPFSAQLTSFISRYDVYGSLQGVVCCGLALVLLWGCPDCLIYLYYVDRRTGVQHWVNCWDQL